MTSKEKVITYIEQHKEEMVTLLIELIQEKSIQGNEQGVQQRVIEKLASLDVEIDCWEPDFEELSKHPYFVSPRKSFKNSPNVVGVLKGSGDGKSIILNGHIDVVPEGDLHQWTQDPFSGHIKDGRIYGRGSTDMKGGNVALLYAMEAVKNTGLSLKGDVIFQSVIEEESGGAGTLATIIRGYSADGAIIPEPTRMKFFPKQQGSAWFRLTIEGKSAHGGTRYEGVSSIEKAMFVIKEIQALEKWRNEQVTDPLYKEIPIPLPINLGVIKGGQWPSSVCDEVVIEGRYGIGPEEEILEAKGILENWMMRIEEKDEWIEKHPIKVEWFGAQWIPGNLDVNHELVTTLGTNYVHVLNEEPLVEASPWGTDGGLLSVVGGIPTVVFGPGETKVAHFPNEYIEIEKVVECAKVLACFLLDWCEEGRNES